MLVNVQLKQLPSMPVATWQGPNNAIVVGKVPLNKLLLRYFMDNNEFECE